MANHIEDEKLYGLADIYNEHGKKEMYNYVRNELGIRNPSELFKRMIKKDFLGYNRDRDIFQFNQKEHEDNVFISLESLCTPVVTKPHVETIEKHSNAMEKLVYELMENRLLEISKYVTIVPYSKQLVLDRTALMQDGYNVIIQ